MDIESLKNIIRAGITKEEFLDSCANNDKDKNESTSIYESSSIAPAAIFDELDINKDNKIDENELLSNYYRNILIIDEMMKNLSFNKNYLLNKNELLITLINVLELLKHHRFIITSESDIKDYSKEFRVYREIDNFAENYITMDLANKKINNSMNFGICGLSYGGIELPIIQKILNKDNSNIGVLRFSQRYC